LKFKKEASMEPGVKSPPALILTNIQAKRSGSLGKGSYGKKKNGEFYRKSDKKGATLAFPVSAFQTDIFSFGKG
jgi:hypothetical protein